MSAYRLAGLVVLGVLCWGAAALAAELPDLGAPGAQRPFARADYRGAVVVLDFYAPWCVPCAGVSRELHSQVGRYYAERGGNRHGLPVHVLAVNIDPSDPEAAARFAERAGLDRWWIDADGRWFELYGGTTVPLVVVVDTTGGELGSTAREVRRWDGNPGIDRLRRVIDSLDGGAGGVVKAREALDWWGTHVQGVVEASGEALRSSDINLYQAGLAWSENRGPWDLRVQSSWNRYDLAFAPAPSDFISQPATLREDQVSVQGRLRVRWADRWQAELAGGGYVGFSDYRSIWLDEYYRQYFEGVPGYQATDPAGWNVAPGVRWECAPGVAWLQAGLVFQQDEVSPGYEKAPFQPLVRGTSELDTLAGVAGLEHVLSRTVRLSHSLRFTDTTERDLRYEYQLSLRWAAAQRWVVRAMGGATLEPPDFHAYQGQVAIERDWANRWFAGVHGRYYVDDGLVRDPKIVSSASPPLQTWQAGLTLRHLGERWTAQLAAGPYWTRYDPVPPISRHFSTLYADRDWLWIEAAVNWRF